MKINCASCHTSAGWAIAADYWKNVEKSNKTGGFNHDNTAFKLKDRHAVADCRDCHQSLVFSTAPTECIGCHADMHQQTAGADCARCHSTANWLINNVTEIHQSNGFPLLGAHLSVDCRACHQSESDLRFERLGNDCVNCHLDAYKATTNPNHAQVGFSTDCVVCHDLAATGWLWGNGSANHLFFPLTGGHTISDCAKCHSSPDFKGAPTDCFACHQNEYQTASAPDHKASNFSTDCKTCHSIEPGWKADNFKQHDDLYFPVFSGKHKGEWDQCVDCHTSPSDYKAFSCVLCHEHNNESKLAGKHSDVSGYSYTSAACYNCHPKGEH